MALERERLRNLMLTLLERLWQCHERTGDSAKALGYARRHVEIEPWNEAGQRDLIRLLALNGQTAAALTQFEACRHLLKKDLGLMPQQETLALVERIRAGDLEPAESATSPAIAVPGQMASEHRLLTLLCCEFDIPDIDDPDDIADALIAPQQQAVDIITAYSGHIIQSRRNGILACFGFPLARENAARQAVRAALNIRNDLAASVGVHSGMVISQGDEPDILGTTTAFTAHLAANAAPATILISEVTERLISGYFECRQVEDGLQRLGMAKPLAAFKVVAESGAATRLESAACLTPLVGRNSELRQLRSFWRSARQGRGQAVLIRGDAGIGKSRLLHALRSQLKGAAVVRELRCFPEFEQSPLHPVLSLFEDLCGFASGDTETGKLAKLSAYLQKHHTGQAVEALELLRPLWHLPVEPSAPESPQHRKQRLISVLVELLQGLAVPHPLLLILEDAHWCDPSTLEWLEVHANRRSAPILTLLTARPEFRLEPDYARIVDLKPLSAGEVSELVQHFAGDLSEEMVRGIVSRADGIPLFAEEMARASQTLGGHRAPLTLQELLTARLDSAREAKPTACLAAALGREFDVDLLRRVAPLAPAAFDKAIAILQNTGLLQAGQANTLAFWHALIQEAAYLSQPKKTRQAAHRRIAEVLQAHFGEMADARAETLARHLTEGGETLAAVGFWLEAGRNAVLQSANQEAAAHFKAGLSLLEQLPDDEHRAGPELQLQAALGGVMIAIKGYGSEDARKHFTRAAYLGRHAGDEAELFPVVYGLWLGGQSDYVTVAPLDLAEKLAQIAKRSADPVHAIAAHYAYGNNLFWLARHREARGHLETVLSSFP
ncbi:MAG: AAA family ATPase, partial [Methylomonas sp.]|nr:AAA family ATPase [Methylomonas sp.]